MAPGDKHSKSYSQSREVSFNAHTAGQAGLFPKVMSSYGNGVVIQHPSDFPCVLAPKKNFCP